MLKKITITILLSSGIMAMLAVSCCTDVQEYWLMDSFTTQLESNDYTIIDDTTSIDTLVIRINPVPIFVSKSNLNWSNLFVNSSFATSCPGPGESGLKYKITGIHITSNQDFNQFLAGDNLSSIVRIDHQTIPDFLNNGYLSPYGSTIEIGVKPTQNSVRNFTITFDFENTTSKTQTTSNVVWQ